VNSTADAYRMNPAEDVLMDGGEIAEGMWVLAADPRTRLPCGSDDDSRLRAQRFRRVTRLRRELSGFGNEVTVFTGEWVDGYQEKHRYDAAASWIVKKAPAPEVSATIARGDVIRIRPDRGPERVMVVSHVEHHLITLADLPAEGEG
jgi:hypothetical protein